MTTRSPFLHLTFNDGPTLHTTEVLEILARHEVPATFFVIGTRVAECGDILSSVYATGHSVGNYSYSQQKSTNLD
jgi:peptidoglycan/xylan/chitin deacetylase (PgdA/CDA1 family)